MIDKIEHALIKLEGFIAAASLFLLLSLSLFEIIARDFFDFGYPDIEIINRNLLVICGVMGAVLATSKLRHIKIDALNTIMTQRQIKLLHCPLTLFSALICLLMSYHGVSFVTEEWHFAPINERWALPFSLIYPAGFGLLSLHFLFNCWHSNT